jgi:hypothetical protein
MRFRIQLLIEVMIRIYLWSTDPHGPILSLQASMVSVHGPPKLHAEPLKLLDFELHPDPDFPLLRIRIPLSKFNVSGSATLFSILIICLLAENKSLLIGAN